MNRLRRPPTTLAVIVVAAVLAGAAAIALGTVTGYQRDTEARHRHELDGRLDRIDETLDLVVRQAGKAERDSDTARAAIVELSRQIDELRGRLATFHATSAGKAIVAASATSHAGAAPPSERWLALAACESTGDKDGVAPHRINVAATSRTSPTYYGPLQESRSTNLAAGGDGDPRDDPLDVTLARGKAFAARSDIDGRGQWPTCWPLVMGDEPR